MKIGIICPVAHLRDFAIASKFHLILPHLFGTYPQYRLFYEERIREGDFVLLDNSVFELEVSLPYEQLFELAHTLNVSEMVAPEVLRDKEASHKALMEFLEFYTKRGGTVPILAVAQGETQTEIISSFAFLNGLPEISSLGLPFDLDYPTESYAGIYSRTLRRVLRRWELVEAISSALGGTLIKPTHLMGLSDPVELQKYRRISWIRSNDSSSAFVHGSAGILITDRGLPCEKIPTKLDFGSSLSTETQFNAVEYNIRRIKQFANAT